MPLGGAVLDPIRSCIGDPASEHEAVQAAQARDGTRLNNLSSTGGDGAPLLMTPAERIQRAIATRKQSRAPVSEARVVGVARVPGQARRSRRRR